MKNLVAFVSTFGVLAGSASAAWAWHVDTCNGHPRGITSGTTFRLNRCSIPSGSTREDAIFQAMNAWNDIYGVYDRFQHTSGSSSCSTTFGDGNYDIVFTHPSNIDDNAGLAKLKYKSCTFTWDKGAVKEADVFISSTLVVTRVDENSTALGARETAIHELGHTLGANHEDGEMSVMCSSDTCGKVGEWTTTGSHTDRAESIFPDDADMAIEYHGSSNAGNPDVVASGWRFHNGGPERNYSTTQTFTRCPGDTISVRFSFGNIGKVKVSSSDPMQLEIVLSSNTTISTSDTTVATFNAWAARGWFGSSNPTVTIPNLSPGTYHFGVIVDSDSSLGEDREGNNSSLVRRKITIPSGC